MKIKRVLILLLVLFIPFICYAEECNKNDIIIESIELKDTRGNVEELSSPNNKNNKINLNTKMNVIGDNITYKVVVKNTSNSDYTFDKNSITKDYLSYDITYEDNSNIIKPNAEKVIYLRLSYDNKPEVEKLVNGGLKENDQISFNLTKETSFINPETGNKILLSLIYLLIPVVISFYLIKKKKPSFIILLVLTIIPYIVNASCTCITTLDINLSLEIDRKEAVFLPGKEVNIKMKELAGDDTSTLTNGYNFSDTNITTIKKSEAEPIDSNKEEKNIVSPVESPYPIYMWYEDNTIYWWSEDETPFLNEDASDMFSKIANLSEIEGLKNFDTTNARSLSSLFSSSGLIEISNLKNWNTSKIEDMSLTFYNMWQLVSTNGLENWDTSNVTDMTYMFSTDISLNDLTAIKNWNVTKVKTMENMFSCCFSIEEIDLSNWETTSLEKMKYMFAQLRITINGESKTGGKLKRIILSDKFDSSKVTDMTSIFYNNQYIEDYSFLKYLDTSNVVTLTRAFYNNANLKSTNNLRSWDISSVKNVSSMFAGTISLTTLEGLENWDASNIEDFSYMFQNAISLKDITVLKNWDTHSATNMSSMFNNMSNLEELDISGFNTKNVTNFAKMFNGSSKLKHIYVGENWSTEANTGETKYVFPTTCELPNFSTNNPNYRYLSYAHAGEGGYLTLKTN